jgi:hypothetical protein
MEAFAHKKNANEATQFVLTRAIQSLRKFACLKRVAPRLVSKWGRA